MTTRRSPDELRAAAERVVYEVEMFHRSLWLLGHLDRVHLEEFGDTQPIMREALSNVLLEAALTHARNLFDFFDPPKDPKPDDIIAAHFMPKGKEWTPPAWQAIVGKPGAPQVAGVQDTDQPLRFHINKRLAHVTYREQNWKGDDRRYDLSQLISILEEPLRRFAATADQSLLSDRWPRR